MTEIERLNSAGNRRGMEQVRYSNEELEVLKRKILARRLAKGGAKQEAWTRIAQDLDISYSLCRRLGNEAAAELVDPEELKELRAWHQARYEHLLGEWWDKAHNDPEAAELVLKIMDKVQNLHGMTRKNVSITLTTDASPEERAKSILEKLEARQNRREEIVDIPPETD